MAVTFTGATVEAVTTDVALPSIISDERARPRSGSVAVSQSHPGLYGYIGHRYDHTHDSIRHISTSTERRVRFSALRRESGRHERCQLVATRDEAVPSLNDAAISSQLWL